MRTRGERGNGPVIHWVDNYRVLPWIVTVVSVAAALFFGGMALGKSRRDAPPDNPSAAAVPTQAAASEERLRVLEDRIELERKRGDHLHSFLNLALLPLAVVTAVLGAGGVVGIVLSFRNETRTGQIHDLLVAGEAGRQARSEELHVSLLDSSQQTISLVNDTLQLAYDASQRAATTLSRRAERSLNDITDEAEGLFLKARYHELFATKFFKIIVEEPGLRNGVGELAQRLASIEGYLDFQEIKLTPAAFLVKGLAHHLNQDEHAAIKALRHAADSSGRARPELQQFAYFWAGYASNNLGNYVQGAEMFAFAHRLAEKAKPLDYELARMGEESRFFELARQWRQATSDDTAQRAAPGGRAKDPEALVREVREVLERLQEYWDAATAIPDGRGVAESIANSQGNVCTWLARAEGGGKAAWAAALSYYEKAGGGLWARFSRLEACTEITGRKKPKKSQYAEVEALAKHETGRRNEPKSLVLFHLTILACRRRQGTDKDVESATQALRNALAAVDDGIMLYSHWWKTNVSAKEFNDYDLTLIPQLRPVSTRA